MDNIPSGWQKFLRNVGWYVATLVVLMVLSSYFRITVLFLLLWIVGPIWGGVLAYQLSQLFFGTKEVISEERLQGYLEQAESYKQKIRETIHSSTSEAKRVPLERLSQQVETWTDAIKSLVARLDSLRQNDLILKDMRDVPQAIEDLEQRLAAEADPEIQAQISKTLANRQKQLASLEALQNMMKRAEIQIESTLSMLGTIYSQLLTGQSTSDVALYNRLSEDVDEEVRQLEDQLEALREVKLGVS